MCEGGHAIHPPDPPPLNTINRGNAAPRLLLMLWSSYSLIVIPPLLTQPLPLLSSTQGVTTLSLATPTQCCTSLSDALALITLIPPPLVQSGGDNSQPCYPNAMLHLSECCSHSLLSRTLLPPLTQSPRGGQLAASLHQRNAAPLGVLFPPTLITHPSSSPHSITQGGTTLSPATLTQCCTSRMPLPRAACDTWASPTSTYLT